jgi:hypothetical protein
MSVVEDLFRIRNSCGSLQLALHGMQDIWALYVSFDRV